MNRLYVYADFNWLEKPSAVVKKDVQKVVLRDALRVVKRGVLSLFERC